jgi:hypothetical protein
MALILALFDLRFHRFGDTLFLRQPDAPQGPVWLVWKAIDMANIAIREYEVIVVGAGPVGRILAIDLGRRRVRSLLVER